MDASSASKVMLQYLRYALVAAESRSFRQAALSLDAQESTISRGIRDLEAGIGFTLFERSHSGVRLTEVGEHYLADIRAALRHLDQAIVAAQSVALGQRGRLRLAVSEDVTTSMLARILAAHRTRWPRVSINLVEMSPPVQFRALRSGLVDLGLMLLPSAEEDFSADLLWVEACVVALPEAHSLAAKSDLQAADLGGQSVIVGHRDRGFQYGNRVADVLHDMGIPVHVAAEVEHIQTALMMAQSGIGITFIPAALAAIPSAGVVFHPVDLTPNSVTVQAVWATDDPSGLVAQFLRTARTIAAADQAGM